MKKLVAFLLIGVIACVGGVAIVFFVASTKLPKLFSLADYKPLLVTKVYDRTNQEIGDFFRERRIIVPADKIPKMVSNAFIAAEDNSFFEHKGIDYLAIVRATIANIKAGKKVQGGSTITQQVAKSLLLTPEKTFTRKIKEALLAHRMESHFSKQEILYLYLNQIYLGQGAYGVQMAAKTYFRKDLSKLTLAEAAILAGLPQAPTKYSPVHNPLRAKERQIYVLNRMSEIGFISKEDAKKAIAEPVIVYLREDYTEEAPYFLETTRQFLTKTLGEKKVLDEGLRVYTTIDLAQQKEAQKQVQEGLRTIDKRQGYRGSEKNLTSADDISKFLLDVRNGLLDKKYPFRTINTDGSVVTRGPLVLTKAKKDAKSTNLPDYAAVGDLVDGVVMKIDDENGLTTVRFAECTGLIDIDTMKWAREVDFNLRPGEKEISKPSQALKIGDVIKVKIVGDKFSSSRIAKKLTEIKKKKGAKAPDGLPDFTQFVALQLEQEPLVQGALLAFDTKSGELLSMVGGYKYENSEFNRALQAARQTGSSFKPIVYAAAMDKGFNPASIIVDSAIVYEGDTTVVDTAEVNASSAPGEKEVKTWKPSNYEGKFTGDVLLRNALIHSMNIPTVKILEKLSVGWVADYARRLGIYSKLNMDLSLGLGSSSVTLYEMTKAYATFARLGQKMDPIFVKKVVDAGGQELLNTASLDARFQDELKQLEDDFENRRKTYLEKLAATSGVSVGATPGSSPVAGTDAMKIDPNHRKEPAIFFNDPKQLLNPSTAYLATSLMQAVVNEGTGMRARALGRPVAGKTGTTNGFFDAWFIGYTPQVVTGVWTGFDTEKTMGKGETGANAALPIWIEYMKFAHEGLPVETFSAPSDILFANIDNSTGRLATATSKEVVKQAFREGTEPQVSSSNETSTQEEKDFLKEDAGQ